MQARCPKRPRLLHSVPARAFWRAPPRSATRARAVCPPLVERVGAVPPGHRRVAEERAQSDQQPRDGSILHSHKDRQGRQGARLRRAGAAWVVAVFAGRHRRCVGRKREGRSPSRGRGRASSASARRPFRARTHCRNRPRRPARGRVRDPTCRNPARLARVRRSALANSRTATRRVLARSVICVVHRCRFRGRDPSRQRRVSRDRRPARDPHRGRTRSPGLVGRVPTRGVRAADPGPALELEQVPVQGAHGAPTP